VSYKLTKRIDKETFTAELVAKGVVSFNINSTAVYLTGEMTDEARSARLAHVAEVEAAHEALTFTKVTLKSAPHTKSFTAEIEALGVIGVGLEHPITYPGVGYVLHNPADSTLRASIKAAAEAHNPAAFSTLSVDISALVISPDGVATGSIRLSDSRSVAAAGKTVRLRLPPWGVAVDSDTFVLDGAGRAIATFGPSGIITGKMDLEFYYENSEADPVQLSVRFGTP